MASTSLDVSLLPTISFLSFSFNNTIGALIIGTILSTFLAGITSLQIYIYQQTPQNDSKFFRGVIYFLWVLDLIHTALFAHATYYYASEFTNPLALLHPQSSFSIDMALGSTNDMIITLIYVGRIWRLCNQNWFAACFSIVSIALSIAAMGASLGVMVTSLKVATYIEWNIDYKWLWYLTFGARSAADLIIALTMVVLLSRSKTRFSRTNRIIRFIVLYCVNTGILTISASVLSIITFAVLPLSFIPCAATALLPKFMYNSMLSFLNSRHIVRDKNFKADILSIPLTTLRPAAAVVVARPARERDDHPFESTSMDSRSTVIKDQTEKSIQFVAV